MFAFALNITFPFLCRRYHVSMTHTPHQALLRAIYKVLRPMARLLMRHGVSYKTFADIARHVFVDVAEEDFALEGRKPSNARTAVLTGINRKDIAKLKGRPHPLSAAGSDSPNPAARVITAWLNDARFHDGAGNPKPLLVEDQPVLPDSFTSLAKEYSSDVPVRALIDELLRIAAIVRDGDKVTLIANAYVPITDVQENLRIFGTAAADLLNTMDHNIGREQPGPFLQRTVSYHNVSPQDLEEIRRRCREEGESLLLKVNEWLSEYEQKQNSQTPNTQTFRTGLGVYYIEGPSPDAPGGDKQQ
jgi:hypothetical protein